MARHIGVRIDGTEIVYRGVVLYLYPGVHSRELKRYTTADGTEYLYHEANAYGPYGSRNPATAQVTKAIKQHTRRVKGGGYTVQHFWNTVTSQWEAVQNGTVPSLVGFVEEQVPSWKPIPATIREA